MLSIETHFQEDVCVCVCACVHVCDGEHTWHSLPETHKWEKMAFSEKKRIPSRKARLQQRVVYVFSHLSPIDARLQIGESFSRKYIVTTFRKGERGGGGGGGGGGGVRREGIICVYLSSLNLWRLTSNIIESQIGNQRVSSIENFYLWLVTEERIEFFLQLCNLLLFLWKNNRHVRKSTQKVGGLKSVWPVR